MNIIGIIPARYASSRLPGKPLADICGQPMIWWVYQQAVKVKEFSQLMVATDNELVREACEKHGMKVVMTREDHERHLDRVHEVAERIPADYYVVVCGDEPLMQAETIRLVLPEAEDEQREYVVRSLMRDFDDPAEALDPSNIKAVVTAAGDCLLLTRSLAPYPYKTTDFKFKKLVGIECFNRKALGFFAAQPMGRLEKIEDVTLLRFIEHQVPVRLIMTEAYQLGVDTPNDLERVVSLISSTQPSV
jgi:3-deoxy-manno-octulosonate cytidylyltransferase (CMP-KDO synthetase)